MAKAPVAGRAKTRLAKDVGIARAVCFARTGARAGILRLARDPRWRTTIAVTPDAAAGSPLWPPGLACIPQGPGDLGARMQRIFDRSPPGPVMIVGTDIPRITTAHVATAFRMIGNADAVFGPAGDGGFWLVAMNQRPRRLAPFGNVRWSSPHALADTRANLAGCPVAFAATLDDVDDAAGLARDASHIGRVVLPV